MSALYRAQLIWGSSNQNETRSYEFQVLLYHINSVSCEDNDDDDDDDDDDDSSSSLRLLVIVENYEPIHQAIEQFCRLIKELYTGEKDAKIKAGLLSLVNQLLSDQGMFVFTIQVATSLFFYSLKK